MKVKNNSMNDDEETKSRADDISTEHLHILERVGRVEFEVKIQSRRDSWCRQDRAAGSSTRMSVWQTRMEIWLCSHWSIRPAGSYGNRSRGWWDGCFSGVRTHLTELFLIHHLWLRSLWQDIIIHIAIPPLPPFPSPRVTVWISPTALTASDTCDAARWSLIGFVARPSRISTSAEEGEWLGGVGRGGGLITQKLH